jgi:hypothetical protein
MELELRPITTWFPEPIRGGVRGETSVRHHNPPERPGTLPVKPPAVRLRSETIYETKPIPRKKALYQFGLTTIQDLGHRANVRLDRRTGAGLQTTQAIVADII